MASLGWIFLLYFLAPTFLVEIKSFHISVVVRVFTVFERIFLQELIKDQVANMYLWPKTLEVPIMDPAKYVFAFV